MMRRLLAIRLRRLADRIDPQPAVAPLRSWMTPTTSSNANTTVTFLTGGK